MFLLLASMLVFAQAATPREPSIWTDIKDGGSAVAVIVTVILFLKQQRSTQTSFEKRLESVTENFQKQVERIDNNAQTRHTETMSMYGELKESFTKLSESLEKQNGHSQSA